MLLAVFAWQQGGEDGTGGPLNAVAEAAVKTQHEGGARVAMRGAVTEPGRSTSLSFTGHAVYDGAGKSRGSLTMPDPKSNDPMRLDFVQDGTEIYMRSSRFGTLPDGREWMGLDLAFGDELDLSPPAGGDAKGELELLENAVGGVDKVGKENVRGVPTTRYRSRISVSETVKRLQEEGAGKAASYVEQGGSPFRVEAWIDAKGLVRRMRLLQLRPGEEGKSPTIDQTTDFFDFGLKPEIDVPDSSEVFDATSLAEEQLDASSGE